MIDNQLYVLLALELHLFYSRIMYEHVIFTLATMPPKETKKIALLENYMKRFERLLDFAVRFSNHRISIDALNSAEMLTQWTLQAEEQTMAYTGIPINTDITKREANIQASTNPEISETLVEQIKAVNQATLSLIDDVVVIQEEIKREMDDCQLFTYSYPMFYGHMSHESMMYRSHIVDLEHGLDYRYHGAFRRDLSWTDWMKEHAEFFRGMLDPSEALLIAEADEFVELFDNLMKESMAERESLALTNEMRLDVMKLQEYNQENVEGVVGCSISSVILPLVSDHFLREANRFLRNLNEQRQQNGLEAPLT